MLSPEEEETAALLEAKQLETDAVALAEKGDVKGALDMFNKAVNLAPLHASGYNNRAQAKRLLGDVDGKLKNWSYCVVS
jgi:Flp pilus assembly protein TadD